jgi:hypothetical protein
MRRRKFIQISAYGAAAVSISLLDGCTQKPINPAIAQPQFLSHIFDKKTMLETGQAYLKQVPSENNKNKLADLLLKNSAITEGSDPSFARSFFDKKIHDDFAKAKTVIVKGWVLSVTEARQCALFSLIQK